MEVLNVESPIEKKLLFKKVLKSYGISKLGTRLSHLLEGLLDNLQRTHSINVYGNTVSTLTINSVCDVRISTEKQRPFVLIPKEELGGAIVDILKSAVSITPEALIKDVAREIFHNSRIGNNLVKKMKFVIAYLIQVEIIESNNGFIRLTNN